MTNHQQTTAVVATSSASWAAVSVVAVGAFVLVTSEFLPIGLLPRIAEDVRVSEGRAGLMVTVPGAVAAITAVATLGLARRLDRRRLLAGLMTLLAVSNLVVASSTDVSALLAGRVLLGMALGGFWTIGGSLGPRLVPGVSAARATALIFSGVSVGTVAGLPAGTLAGDTFGWRATFWGGAVAASLVAGMLLAVLPSVPSESPSGTRGILGLLRSPLVVVALLATMLIHAGHFAAYTFIAPFLDEATGISGSSLSVVLLCFGSAGLAGNITAGWTAQRGARRSVALSGALMTVSIVALTAADGHRTAGIVAVVAWGFAFGMTPVSTQTLVLRAAPRHLEGAAALFVASAQGAIGLGSWFGGTIADAHGVTDALRAGAALSLLCCLAVASGCRGRSASRSSRALAFES